MFELISFNFLMAPPLSPEERECEKECLDAEQCIEEAKEAVRDYYGHLGYAPGVTPQRLLEWCKQARDDSYAIIEDAESEIRAIYRNGNLSEDKRLEYLEWCAQMRDHVESWYDEEEERLEKDLDGWLEVTQFSRATE